MNARLSTPAKAFLALSLALAALRWFSPERSLFDAGPRAWLDALFAIGLLGLVLWIAAGVGDRLLAGLRLAGPATLPDAPRDSSHPAPLARLDGPERLALSLALGLGTLVYGILLLACLGLLTSWAVAAWLLLAAVFAWREISANGVFHGLGQPVRLARSAWSRLEGAEKLLVALLGLLLLLSFVQALAPPWDYDGLIYHLQGPRIFLHAGRINPPGSDNPWFFYPFTVELLYAVGLAFGSDAFATLLHLSSAVLLALATLSLARRQGGRGPGLLAIAILVGMPIFPIWASLAYNDIPWALFEFLSLYAALLWREDRRPAWLALAGLLMGFALGTKYMALGGGAVLAMWIFANSFQRSAIGDQQSAISDQQLARSGGGPGTG